MARERRRRLGRPKNTKRKFLLLTYSQTSPQFNPEIIKDLIHNRDGTCLIAKEQHQDGGDHYHVFCDFSKRHLQTRNLSIFDVPVGNNKTHHPNWLAITETPWKTYDYTMKEGKIVYNDCKRPDERHQNNSSDNWAKLMTATTEDEFMAGMASMQPRALVTCFANVQKFISTKYNTNRAAEYKSPQIQILDSMPQQLRDWIDGFNAGCELGQRLDTPNERYDPKKQQPFMDIPNYEDLDLSSYMDLVDLEKQSLPDHWEDTHTSVAHSTLMTSTTTAPTRCLTTSNVDWGQWLDGKAGWEANINLSLPTNTKKNGPSSGEDILYSFPTPTLCWNEESTETGSWPMPP